MTTATIQFTNPLEALLEKKKQEEAEQAARLEAEAAARQAALEVAEQQRRAEAKKQHLIREVRSFAEGFLHSIYKVALKKNWSAAAIEEADAYAKALLCHLDRELPHANPGIAGIVRDRFAFGLAMKGASMPNIMSTNYLVGQRQDWFPELFAKKQVEVMKFKSQ